MSESDDKVLKERIINLRESRNLSQTDLAKMVGMSNSTLNKIEAGTRKISSSELKKFAIAFNVSSDYLLGNTDDTKKKKYYDLSDKEKNDIAIQAEKLMEGIETGSNLNFYGEPATKEQKDRLLMAVKMAMEMNKMEAKKKFTPKKYRD